MLTETQIALVQSSFATIAAIAVPMLQGAAVHTAVVAEQIAENI